MKVYKPKEIPDDYVYLYYTNDYIDYYNVATARNRDVNYYRYYYKIPAVEYRSRYIGNYSTTLGYQQELTDNWLYSSHSSTILLSTFIIVIFIIFVLNNITSIVKRGGIFGTW